MKYREPFIKRLKRFFSTKSLKNKKKKNELSYMDYVRIEEENKRRIYEEHFR